MHIAKCPLIQVYTYGVIKIFFSFYKGGVDFLLDRIEREDG